MNRIISVFFIIFTVSLISACIETKFTLKNIQGGWFSDCEDPAVEFLIRQNEYSGDFHGSHPLILKNDLLIFENGLVENHSVNVSFKRREYKILSLSKDSMVLEYSSGNGSKKEWTLFLCQ